jgi:hypothetical protein
VLGEERDDLSGEHCADFVVDELEVLVLKSPLEACMGIAIVAAPSMVPDKYLVPLIEVAP